MPFNAGTIAAVVVFLVAIAVFAKTRRIGATVAIVAAGFVVLAASDPSFLSSGANGVKKILNWAIGQLH